MNRTLIHMTKWGPLFFLAVLLLFFQNCSQEKNRSRAFEELIMAERSFAKLSEDSGMGTAFLTYLTEDAILFRPTPMQGKSRYQSVTNLPGVLRWEPFLADIAGSGEMGFTTGPWELRRKGTGDSADAYGHYVSVWKKTDDGWRVVLDIGISHPFPGFMLQDTFPKVKIPDYATGAEFRTQKNLSITSLILMEQDFTMLSQDSGIAAAYRKYSVPEIIFNREGEMPVHSLDKALELFDSGVNKSVTWKPEGGEISLSGDFGYTYGISESPAERVISENRLTESYLHIWRNFSGADWHLVLDITNTVPEMPE